MKNMAQHRRIFEYIGAQYGARPEYLWRKYPEFAVFRNCHNNKWFAMIMNITADKLGLRGTDMVYVLNIHCSPSLLATVLNDGDFLPGYHMNKATWSTIVLDGHLTDAQIFPLIQASYESVAPAAHGK